MWNLVEVKMATSAPLEEGGLPHNKRGYAFGIVLSARELQLRRMYRRGAELSCSGSANQSAGTRTGVAVAAAGDGAVEDRRFVSGDRLKETTATGGQVLV